MATASELEAVSARFADVSTTVGATSVIVMVNSVSDTDVSWLVALMVTLQVAPVDSRSGDDARETIPVLDPTVKIPAQV